MKKRKNNSNNFLIQAKIIRRSLIGDNMFDYDKEKSSTTDHAIPELDKPAPHMQLNECFNTKSKSSSESFIATINSKFLSVGSILMN
ncbi:unnamed protein product [Rotaria socialis]|uniref:Uncharacterized protein n=1 Tax=Rotaria socialis TaxID=392032 RepID=A0A818GPV0_9BILA|nr:unnamed protein product [Rotaria socialis]